MIEICWKNVDMLFRIDSENDSLDEFEAKCSWYEQLCTNSKSSDFYFSVSRVTDEEVDDSSYVTICPKEFFDRVGYFFDQGLEIDHLLPSDFDNCDESAWFVPRSLGKVKTEMLDRGFIESDQFNEYAKDIW